MAAVEKTAETSSGTKSFKQFDKTPEGWQKYWESEIDVARKAFQKWHKACKIITKEFLDERADDTNREERRINYFWADTSRKKALLFANENPGVDVSRRYADADDDMARISGPLILKRVLETDIERGYDGTNVAGRYCLLDFLMFGFGNAWVRYTSETDKGKLVHEDVPVDYVHHDDYLHSPCRTFEEMRWALKQVAMTQDELAERFGAELAVEIALNQKKDERAEEARDPWDRSNVLEIWSKEHRKVFWVVEGFDKILDSQKDILGLRDFWPFPRPMVANCTTTAFMPRPDFALLQDLYRDINNLMSRIHLLQKALRVAGVYDRTVGEITRLLDGSLANELIPIENINNLADKGGLEGVISWLPIKEVVETIGVLEDKLARRQQILYELSGDSDVTRGAAGEERESATSVRSRVKFANVRVNAAQEEFARFMSDLQALRAEVMVRHFQPATFLKRSNVLFTPDAPLALQAVQELKKEFPSYRVKIQSDQLAAQDFATIKQERGEWLKAFSSVLREGVPLVQVLPSALPLVLEAAKWALGGLKGSATIEGAFDKFIKQTQAGAASGQGQQQQPDPNMMKAQGDQMKTQTKLQADMMLIQAKTEAEQKKTELQIASEQQRQAIQTQANLAETTAQEQIKLKARQQQEQDKAVAKAVADSIRPMPGERRRHP